MHLLVALLAAALMAPPTGSTARQKPAAPEAAPSSPRDPVPAMAGQGPYTIGPDDSADDTVFDEPELTNRYRVDTDGMITFPLIGRVPASGLRLTQFQERLRAQLAAGTSGIRRFRSTWISTRARASSSAAKSARRAR